jgi:hypothetical protein
MTRSATTIWRIVEKAMRVLGCAGTGPNSCVFPLAFHRRYGNALSHVRLDAPNRLLAIESTVPIRILPRHRLRTCRALMQCNFLMQAGQFLLNTATHQVLFRTILPLDRSGPTPALVRRLLRAHRLAIVEHLPRLAADLHENISLKQALIDVWQAVGGGTALHGKG